MPACIQPAPFSYSRRLWPKPTANRLRIRRPIWLWLQVKSPARISHQRLAMVPTKRESASSRSRDIIAGFKTTPSLAGLMSAHRGAWTSSPTIGGAQRPEKQKMAGTPCGDAVGSKVYFLAVYE